MYILFINSGDKCDIFFSAQFNNNNNNNKIVQLMSSTRPMCIPNLKNRSMEKKQEPCKLQCKLQLDFTVLRTVNSSCGSHKSLFKK